MGIRRELGVVEGEFEGRCAREALSNVRGPRIGAARAGRCDVFSFARGFGALSPQRDCPLLWGL
jgi:hypothetical protein